MFHGGKEVLSYQEPKNIFATEPKNIFATEPKKNFAVEPLINKQAPKTKFGSVLPGINTNALKKYLSNTQFQKNGNISSYQMITDGLQIQVVKRATEHAPTESYPNNLLNIDFVVDME